MSTLKTVAAVLLTFLLNASVPAQEKPAALDTDKPAAAKPDKTAKPPVKTTKPSPAKPADKKTNAGTGNSGTAPADASLPGGPADPALPTPKVIAITPPVVEPNWHIDNIVLKPFGTTNFSRDKITLNPVDGHSFVEAGFRLNALRSDAKAVENYAKAWKNVNRKELSQRIGAGARLFEMKNLYLIDSARGRYPAIWNLDEAVRYNVYTAEFAPNSTRTSHQGFWKGNADPAVPIKWLDSEQSFLTRTTRPPNRPEIVEWITYFSGILATQNPVDVNFLFSVPNDVDRETLSLVYEGTTFALK
jgi:hypothetical protein